MLLDMTFRSGMGLYGPSALLKNSLAGLVGLGAAAGGAVRVMEELFSRFAGSPA